MADLMSKLLMNKRLDKFVACNKLEAKKIRCQQNTRLET